MMTSSFLLSCLILKHVVKNIRNQRRHSKRGGPVKKTKRSEVSRSCEGLEATKPTISPTKPSNYSKHLVDMPKHELIDMDDLYILLTPRVTQIIFT